MNIIKLNTLRVCLYIVTVTQVVRIYHSAVIGTGVLVDTTSHRGNPTVAREEVGSEGVDAHALLLRPKEEVRGERGEGK